MRKKMLEKLLWTRVQVRPIAKRFDCFGVELGNIDDDWIPTSIENDVLTIQNTRTQHIARLGADHIRNYDSNHQRDWDGLKHGFLNLNSEISLDNRDLRTDPIWPK